MNENFNVKYLSIEDVAESIGVTKETIRAWIKKGMPAYKIGKQWRFVSAEIDEWIKSGKSADII